MQNKVKNYLKDKTREEVKRIVKHPDLTEEEQWLIYYTYGENRYAINTAAKLNISERQFYMIKEKALIKLYYILNL